MQLTRQKGRLNQFSTMHPPHVEMSSLEGRQGADQTVVSTQIQEHLKLIYGRLGVNDLWM